MCTDKETFDPVKDILEQTTTMAGLFFRPRDIAIALGFKEEQTENFLLDIENENISDSFAAAYFQGRLTAEVELRQAIKNAAKNGSNPAQNTMIDFLNSSKL